MSALPVPLKDLTVACGGLFLSVPGAAAIEIPIHIFRLRAAGFWWGGSGVYACSLQLSTEYSSFRLETISIFG